MLALEIAAVLLLIALNGVLALAELAVVSSRRGRLKMLAGQGVPGAATALELHDDPGRFLSTVQVGITLVGVLAGAVSGRTLGARLSDVLADAGMPLAYAEAIGVGAVVIAITYLSVVLGELVPKRIALRSPERFAVAVAPLMVRIARVARPVVVALDLSGRLVMRLFGAAQSVRPGVTDEDVHAMITEATTAGVIEPEERSMIAQVMRLGDRPVRALMTPRPEVEMLDLDASDSEIRARLRSSVHSRLPVYRGDPNEILGIVQAKDVLDTYLAGGPVDPSVLVRAPVIVPETLDALDLIGRFKESAVHMALVYDEYGHLQGIVTLFDVLAAIAGEFRTEEGPPYPKFVERADGSWLLDGDLPADEMADLLGVRLPSPAGFDTTAGFLLATLGHLPSTGDHVAIQGWRFEVVDLDGRRIDKILAERLPGPRRRG